jgi:lipopolysaccharide biosynthesis regulator YciM
MIVKNESKIITRLFDSVLSIIDSYCICDTGSTDDTIDIIKTYFEEKKIIGKVFEEPFRDFSYNRNIALNACASLEILPDYILLMDADMVLNISEGFDKSLILNVEYEEFRILQGNENQYHSNTRIIKNNGTFKYIGVTHEYIFGEHMGKKLANLSKDILYITDIGDGGSKEDKFNRDIKLLKEGLEEDENNSRYHFYLGNSYLDTNKNILAIESYKKVLSMDGCRQEKYITCLRIYDAYKREQLENTGIPYLIQSYQFDNNRVEGIFRLIKYYYDHNQYEVAMTYYLLIGEYYENKYLTKKISNNGNSITYEKEDIHISFKLFAIQQDYNFYLPYYMICVASKMISIEDIEANNTIKDNKYFKIGIRMYEIIFELQFIPSNVELFINLFNNLEKYINKIPEDRKENFIYKYKEYMYLVNKKYDVPDLYFTSSQKYELEDNLAIDNPIAAIDNPIANPIAAIDNPITTIDNPIATITSIKDVKIILNLMIKNESSIIERCINAVLEYVDGFSILDTGSTDNTIDICYQALKSTGKPFVINIEPFKNFGYNRTKSFESAVKFCDQIGWDKDLTYAMLIDADMVIKPSDQFKIFKNTMTANGYQAIQKNGHMTYYNTRFLKISHGWKCLGATHEYWSGNSTDRVDSSIFYIDDINDGGCKSDKAERDIRLLKEDINENKNVDRSHFYLAQTYKGIGQYNTAIEYYEKRIQLGGWYEEIWYSYYQIGKCYLDLKDYNNMELWLNKAYDYNNRRSEPLYILTKYFRENSQHYKAYHYYLKGVNIPYPQDEILFIEHDIYNGLFGYENTIIGYYINKTRKESLLNIVSYINKFSHNLNNVWDSLHFYIEPLMGNTYYGKYTKFNFMEHNEYRASSCSILSYLSNGAVNGTPTYINILNIRYVNYTITESGHYIMHSADGNVKTKNAVYSHFPHLGTNMDSITPIDSIKFISEDMITYSSNIEGLEDVRIFNFKNKIYFTASSKNITNDDNIKMVIGEYNHHCAKISNVRVVDSPEQSCCEKNWIYIPNYNSNLASKRNNDMNFIYGWYPLKIGSVNVNVSENNNHYSNLKLDIHTVYNTPNFFNRFRGSTHLVKYGDNYWGVVHFVKYSMPRVYYHCLVVFNEDIQPIQYSLPFCFRQLKIEYCIGFQIIESSAMGYFIFSENDSNPGSIEIPLNRFQMINI